MCSTLDDLHSSDVNVESSVGGLVSPKVYDGLLCFTDSSVCTSPLDVSPPLFFHPFIILNEAHRCCVIRKLMTSFVSGLSQQSCLGRGKSSGLSPQPCRGGLVLSSLPFQVSPSTGDRLD